MAAAYLPSPCSLRSTWGANHRSCRRGVGVPGAEVRWGIDSTLSLKKLGCFSRASRTHFSFKKTGRWRRTGTVRARFDFRGSSTEQAREEDASILVEMTTLVDELLKLKEVVNETNKGVGADVRNRVDVLYNRATLLKYSAENMIANGGRVPVQLTATMKGLQREHASVGNIVHLAMKAGPVITDVEAPPSSIDSFIEEAVKVTKLETSGDDTQISAFVLKEKEEGNASVFESLTLESSLKTVDQPATFGTEGYVMSAPAANNSSPLAAFREEIERRVIEQLARKTKLTEPELDDGHPTSEGLRLLQNLPLRGRMSTKRERKAEKYEAQAADTSSTEFDAPEARPFFLQESQELSSLADEQQQSTTAVEAATNSKEREKLLRHLATLEQLLSAAQEGPARAEKAEVQLQHLTEEMVATVPLDVHEQVVRLERESLVVARTKLAQVTTELREKEAMLVALKQEMITEQKSLRDKVRELSSELSERITPEEVEVAVNNAVHELETELRKTLKRAESMKLELEANENLLKQLQQEWNVERASLCRELANVKRKLTELQMEQAGDRTRFIEAADKVNELEDSVIRLQNSMVEAEEARKHRDRSVLATVKSLVADMLKTKRAQTKSSVLDFRLLEASKSLDVNDKCEVEDPEALQLNNAEDVLGSMFSVEKATALEAFFIMMGVLIQQENEKMTTTNLLPREISNGAVSGGSTDGILEHDLSNLRSSKVDVKMIKPTITLYYESSWEFAYLHYSADNSAWTELPGVCMRNEVLVNNVPVKVIDVEGNSIEFVLTDGRGSWDCAPSGENYHIRSSGTFFLSFGLIEQRHDSSVPDGETPVDHFSFLHANRKGCLASKGSV